MVRLCTGCPPLEQAETAVTQAERRILAGVALQRLHELAAPEAARALTAHEDVSVHIDTLPAMTGATRFFERGRPWVYSKVRHAVNTVGSCRQVWLGGACVQVHLRGAQVLNASGDAAG